MTESRRGSRWFLAGLCLAAWSLAAAAEGEEKFVLRTFKKLTLTTKFYSEGMYYGDFNRDGQQDVVAGPFWYAGPEFSQRHEFMPAKEYDPNGYSNAFFNFAGDINGDGWDDILVVGFPGKEAFWYQNPQGKEGTWQAHLIHPKVDNESPGWGPMTAGGRPALVFHTGGQLGYALPDPAQPTQPWRFQAVSRPGGWGQYTHGLGFGDVNGDGRIDLLLREGWWENEGLDQPWPHRPAAFGGGGAQMHVYDVDGDGDPDVITSLQAHGYGLAWFENTGRNEQGAIQYKQHTITGSKPEENRYGVKFSQLHAVDLVDMDGDGVKDIVTGKRYWAHGPKGDAEPDAPAVLYWFRTVRTSAGVDFVPYLADDDSGVGTQVTAADISGDKQPDILVGNKKGHFVFLQQVREVSREEWEAAQRKPRAEQ